MSKIELKRNCPSCGQTQVVSVEQEDYDKYQNGMYVQNAFPYLSAEQRELFITGICPECWEKMFS